MRLAYSILFILLHCVSSLNAQTNRALVVGISKYPDGSGWDKTHAQNDLRLICPLLIENGYSEENIIVLADEQATKTAIIWSLKYLSTQSEAGDYIYIHFSCHGQQMYDDNSDEEDGLDEAIIPYDAKKYYQKGIYEGEKHLRDDELGEWLEKIRRKITNQGNVIVLIDACHSGTVMHCIKSFSFLEEYFEGLPPRKAFGPNRYVRSGLDESKLKLSVNKDSLLAPIHGFTACEASEVNFLVELFPDKYYGLLSYAFCEQVRGSSNKSLSNIDFFKQLRYYIENFLRKRKWLQTPTFESSHEDKEFRIARPMQ